MRPGSRPPAVVDISAAPTTLSPKSSGWSSASEMTRHPAHRVAHDDAPAGDGVLDDAAQVVAELVDRAVVLVGPRRAAVAALVVEDGADLAAVGRALEVPAVEVEGVAVDEDHGEVVVGGRAAAEVGRLVDLDVQVERVVGHDDPRRAVQLAERRPAPPRRGRPMIRLWRTMPAAPAAAASPAAPTTVPKIRPLMLIGCLPRVVVVAVDVAPDEPAADAGHDLVADGADGLRPVLGGRLAAVAGAEEDDLGAGRRQLAVEVDDDLVHADPAADRAQRVLDPHRRGVAGRAGDAVAVPGRHEADARVVVGDPGVAVGDAVTGRDRLAHHQPGAHRHRRAQAEPRGRRRAPGRGRRPRCRSGPGRSATRGAGSRRPSWRGG